MCFEKLCVKAPLRRWHKSFDINHCVKVKGIQSSAQEEEPVIACFAPALLGSVLQIKQQLLHTAEHLSVCAWLSCTCLCVCVFVYMCLCVCSLVSYCKNKLVQSLCQDTQTSASATTGQEELEFLLISDGQTQGSLHLKHHCFCQGPRVQSRRAEQLWSAVLCDFFFSQWITLGNVCVCVWDAWC